jgi:hypothetical protein
MAEEGQDASKRGRSRKNVIGHSIHRDEYVTLMRNGWSSMAISRFAMFRHGEDIPDRTIRLYRKKLGLSSTRSAMQDQEVDPEAIVDILKERTELIHLQKARIAIDTAHERTMNKLFSGTRHEIAALNSLITATKEDMQDFGLFPKLGEVHNVHLTGQVQGLTPGSGEEKPDDGTTSRYAPPVRTLGALFSEISPQQEQQVARMLHQILPPVGGVASNGHGVVEGEVDSA